MSRFGLGFTGRYGVPGNDAFTKILLHMDGANGGATFTDDAVGAASSHVWSSIGGAVTSTGLVKLGATSLFKPQNGYIATPDNADFTLGSSDFTVDFWFNANSNASTQIPIFGQVDATGAAGNSSIYGLRNTNGVVGIGISSGSYTSLAGIGIDTRDSNWHHFALVRNGNALALYVNGSLVDSAAFSAAVPNSSSSFAIGKAGDFVFADQASAYIDEFRLSVGIARWTSNFTPPDAPYI